MLKFTGVDGTTTVLRAGIILGAKSAMTETGPMLGAAVVLTQGGPLGPFKTTPMDVRTDVREEELLEQKRQLVFAEELEAIKAKAAKE